MEQNNSGIATFAISKSRLEYLFDGIFAIAMTILVLELKVPELADRRSVAELARVLGHHAPTFLSYLLSFSMLGILWYRHNHFYRYFQHINRRMLALHLIQLAMAAFFPFCAALFGRYHANPLAMVFYSGCIMVYLWSAMAVLLVAKKVGSLSPQLDPSDYKRYWKRHLRGCIIVTVIFLYFLIVTLSS